MRIFRKSNGSYYVRYKDGSSWKEASLYTKDNAEAQYNLREWLKQQDQVDPLHVTIEELWDKFVPTLFTTQFDRAGYLWAALKNTFAKLNPSVITDELCQAYAKASPRSPGTVRLELAYLQKCLRDCLERGSRGLRAVANVIHDGDVDTRDPRPHGRHRQEGQALSV